MKLLGGFKGTIKRGTMAWLVTGDQLLQFIFPVDFTTFFFRRNSGFVSFVYNGHEYIARPEDIIRE